MTSKRERIVRVLAGTRVLPLLRARPIWRGLLVLNYHRIGDPGRTVLDRGVFSGTQEAFDAHLTILKRETDLVCLDDLPSVLHRRGRSVLVTFDDGYRDNYELAFPILTAHGVRAAFFLCTKFLDQRPLSWWDEIAWMIRTSPKRGLPANPWLPSSLTFDEPERERAVRTVLARYKALPAAQSESFLTFLAETTGSGRSDPGIAADLWMTWDMVREMVAAGMDIGGHTVNHPVLARLSAEQQDAEIGGCQQRLTAELGGPARGFAYPVGSRDAFNAATRTSLRAHGIEFAFSFYGGYCRLGHKDPYDLPRVYVTHDTSQAAIEALVTVPQLVAAPTPRLLQRQ